MSRPQKTLLILLVVMLAGAALLLMPVRTPDRGPLVLAAASLNEALNEAADAWARTHPRPVVSLAASSALARQIEAGAPADLFISADQAWMDHVAGKSLLRPGTRTDLLSNRLVLIAPADSGATLRIAPGFPLAEALGAGRLAIANPDAVPAGRYGKAALTYLGIWPQVESRLAPADNVRGALTLVERGEAPFGIVYATDAHASTRVRVVDVFPAEGHLPIVYPVATLGSSTHPDAEAFRAFLLSPEGQAIFARWGFAPN